MQEGQDGSAQSLISFLTSAGVGSRRQCFHLLVMGEVTVNDRVETSTAFPVDPGRDLVVVEGRVVAAAGARVYLKMHKPFGVLSTTRDARGRTTVLDLAPRSFKASRLFPVGRLDADTTGLLLLTNDGALANRLTHPRYRVEKEYHVDLDAALTPAQEKAFREGVSINGERTAPARLRRLATQDGARYSVTLRQGRKRQIRLMCLAVGRSVRALKRVRIHNLRLGSLPVGASKALSGEETQGLKTLFHAEPGRGGGQGGAS